MKKNTGMKGLVLTCCAVGVLMSNSQAWAVDNCTQIIAQNEADVDSTPDSATDPGGSDTVTFANILANNPTDDSNDTDQIYDDEDCVSLDVLSIHDFGDAPDSYGTTLANGGAQHEVVPWLKLGALIDDEADGSVFEADGTTPNPRADGDDTTDSADEDGVSIPSMTAGQVGPVITLPAPTNTSGADAFVACWIDYDGNGVFDASEFGSASVPDGNAVDISITMPDVPAGVPTADALGTGIDSYARCRLSNTALTDADAAGVLNDSTGIADGEVEDYPVDFAAEAVFDLALTKALADTQATDVNVGEDITFTITITNQGGVDATDIIVTDYIPAGLTLNDTDWTAGTNAAGDAIATLNTGLVLPVATGSTTVNITFTVDGVATGDLLNTAEISSADGGVDINGDPLVDEDSTADTINTDTVKDDVITEDGKADPLNDEDDHDIATIHVNEVDLELGKRVLDETGTTEIIEAHRGDTVIYELTVTNDGPDTATGIVVSDMLPEGVTYVSDNAVSPAVYDDATGEWVVGSDLAVGASATLQITVTIDSTGGGGTPSL